MRLILNLGLAAFTGAAILDESTHKVQNKIKLGPNDLCTDIPICEQIERIKRRQKESAFKAIEIKKWLLTNQHKYGVQGPTGQDGPKGQKGQSGESGPSGIPGKTGAKGVAGLVGTKGSQGLAGESGDQG